LGTKRGYRLAAEGLPDLLTVEEAAVLLRIGRNQAYDLARQWRATDGMCGLPVIELSPHTLRVPLHALEAFVGAKLTGPLPIVPRLAVAPDPDEAVLTRDEGQGRPVPGREPTEGVAQVDGPSRAKVTPLRRPRRPAPPDQLSLFDPSDSS
jgi:hypothetical protein